MCSIFELKRTAFEIRSGPISIRVHPVRPLWATVFVSSYNRTHYKVRWHAGYFWPLDSSLSCISDVISLLHHIITMVINLRGRVFAPNPQPSKHTDRQTWSTGHTDRHFTSYMMSKHILVDIVTITTKLIKLVLDFGEKYGKAIKHQLSKTN